MTIQEIEQKLNITNEWYRVKLEECYKALAELKESKKGKWKPKCNEEYWYRDTNGEYISCKRKVGSGCDDWRAHYIPIFESEEKCRKYWHFMDTVKQKSYEFSKEELVDINIEKWYIGLKHGGLCVDFVYGVGLFGAIYFKTEEDCQYIIDNFKEELMEYWL